MTLDSVKHIYLVLSGKGGVGKSTVATQIALGLVQQGKKVGILDVDLCGPSIPHMLNLKGHDIHQCSEGWVPVYTDSSMNLAVMSIGFLLKNDNDAVVWRGPKKNAMIKQFLTDVYWGEIDYLVIDTPPGTSDEHITTVEGLQCCNPDGAILVTTPQFKAFIAWQFYAKNNNAIFRFPSDGNVSAADVRREITFCRKTGMPILGIVENMSGFVCPTCAECSNLFSSGGGQALADHAKIPYLGNVPIDPCLSASLEKGENFMEKENSPTIIAINNIIRKLVT